MSELDAEKAGEAFRCDIIPAVLTTKRRAGERPAKQRDNRGFGLVSLAFGLGLIAIAVGSVTLWLLPQRFAAKTGQAQYDISRLQLAIEKYHSLYGQYPLTLDQLLLTQPPLLKDLPPDPYYPGVDPNNRTYYYYTTLDRQYYHVYSCGPNQKNDSDIDNYKFPRAVYRALGSGEDLKDTDDIFATNLPVVDK